MPDDESARARFEAVVGEVVDPIRAYLHRRTDAATADDILAETLSVLWRRLADVPGGAAVPWSIGVARLQLKNAERSARRRGLLVRRIAAMDPPALVLDAPARSEADDAVQSTLASMSAREAELLRLWIWEDLSPGEIATVLGISSNAASIRLSRARRSFVIHYRQEQRLSGHDGVTEGERR